jgi:hypothetical protein
MEPSNSAAAAAAVDADRQEEAPGACSAAGAQVNNQPAEVSRSANGTDGAALAHHEGADPWPTQQTRPHSGSPLSSPACQAEPAAARTVDPKREATAVARAALAGITVHRSTTEAGQAEWIVSRWSLTRAFSDLDELERWLDMVTGRKTAGTAAA